MIVEELPLAERILEEAEKVHVDGLYRTLAKRVQDKHR